MKNKKEEIRKEFKRRLYRFVLKLIAFVDKLDRKDPTCRVIGEQLIDRGTGILSNYLEAQVSSSKKDFTNYFHHCLKCCNESEALPELNASCLPTGRKDISQSRVSGRETLNRPAQDGAGLVHG